MVDLTQSVPPGPVLLLSCLSQLLTIAVVIGGFLVNYVRGNAKQDNHTVILAEHGQHLDKLAEAIKELSIVNSRLEERTKAQQYELDRQRRSIEELLMGD